MTINEVLEALTPENARFVSGQDLFLYVPKAQTNKRYGLAKYSPDDFSIDSNGVLTLLLPKSQTEDYFEEVRGGTREETVLADPAINLLNLHLTDKDLYNKVNTLYDRDGEIYGSLGRSGTVLANVDLSKLHYRDNELQDNIDHIIQDSLPSTSTESTYSANKITQLIREAKMEGLHFVGYIGSTVGRDYNDNVIIKEGALWYQSDEVTAPSNPSLWENIYKCINGEWVIQSGYTAEDFDIWKNVNIPDDKVNAWWYFENGFEVLDFNVDMSLYYTKVESDEKFKSNFTYGNYLYETNNVMNIVNMNMPTRGALTEFVKGTSGLNSTNVEDAIKELEIYTNDKFDEVNARPRWLLFTDTPTRVGDYSVTTDGVYMSVSVDDQIVWKLITNDLDNYLLRSKADVNVATGLAFNSDPSTGYLTASLSLQNIDTGEISQTPISIPVATSETDGVMPATAMVAIDKLDIRMSALESGAPSYFVSFPSDNPTQSALTLLYQQVSGDQDEPGNQTMLIDLVRNIYYQYFDSTDPHWQGSYTYRYGVASSGYLGLVSSSQQDGQIYVEPVTGVMSLNGYSEIINTFNTLYGGTGRTEIDVNQVPALPASKITSGTLNSDRLPVVPISKGGTGNDTFSAYKLVVTGNIDQSSQTPSSLLDGPAFGALNTILIGQGANQLPIFKSIEDIGLELVSRKVTSFVNPTDVQYPSAKLVKESLDAINSALSTEVTTRQNADNTLQSSISTNESNIASLDIRITSAESNISDIPNKYVSYIVSQVLTEEQKALARQNIGAGSSGFSGSYVDLVQKPTLNTNNTTSQNTLSDETINGTINLHKVSKTGKASDLVDYADLAQAQTVTNQGLAINQINDKIPTEASSTNKLADKAFVADAIQTSSAYYRGSWSTWSAVPTSVSQYPADSLGNTTPTSNDYMVVQDASGYNSSNVGTWRFKYSGNWATNGKNGWLPEYQVNEEPLTIEQLNALNSGITSDIVLQIETNKNNILTLQSDLSDLDTNKQDKLTALGSTIKPVYVSSDGTLSAASTYAGGTKVTLNGSNKGGSTASLYAPTSAGTSGYFLKSNGSGSPTWQQADTSVTEGSTNLVTSGGVYSALLDKIYPVGSIYLSTVNTSPESFLGGKWERLPDNYAFWTSSTYSGVDATNGRDNYGAAPNIAGKIHSVAQAATYDNASMLSGAFSRGSNLIVGLGNPPSYGYQTYLYQTGFSAASGECGTNLNQDPTDSNTHDLANHVYGKQAYVKPRSYNVFAWRRYE